MKRERLRRLVEWLRSEHPTPFPVRVLLVKLPGRSIHRVDGATERRGRYLYILIDRRLTWAEMVDVLCHEWAHAMDWRHDRLERGREVDHTDEWALAYGRIYRDIHDHEVLQ